MVRTYELGLVFEPRQNDEDIKSQVGRYREMIEAGGGKIAEEANWGKRKLAYTIENHTEGKYVFLFVEHEKAMHWPDIERNLMQNESVLRHLVVRTDLDLKRAATKGRAAKAGDEAEAPERTPDGRTIATDSDAETGTEVKTEVKTEAGTEVKTEAKTEVKTEVKTEAKTEAKTETDTGAESDTDNDTDTDGDTDGDGNES